MVTIEQKYNAALRIMNFMVDLLPNSVVEQHATSLAFKLDAFEQANPDTKDADDAVLNDQIDLAEAMLQEGAN